jgi:YD repeat-containing protein
VDDGDDGDDGDLPWLLDLPDTPHLRVEGADIALDISGVSLSGNFVFEKISIPSKFLHGGAGNDRFLLKSSTGTNGVLGSGAGNMYISAAYGTTRADVPVCEVGKDYMYSSPGQSVDCGFGLHYDSGKADGSIARRQTVLGYGWTHNYNIYLIDKSPDIFIADGKGRMTRLRDDGLGGYIPSDGQTHTLTQFDPNTYLLEEVDGSTMAFQLAEPVPAWAGADKIYLLAGIQDARGRVIELTYDGSSLLQTITDPYGRQIQLAYSDYSGKKLLDTITDPNMQVTSIDCNDGNDLWQITDPEGYSLTYGYDPNHRLTSVTLKDGNT